jgi:hypothetical protein
MKDEALKLALETLESIQAVYPCETVGKRITAIKEALAQPAQQEKFCDANCVWTDHHPDCKLAQPAPVQPVAWMNPSWIDPDTRGWQSDSFESIPIEGWLPLYTAPPAQPAPVPLAHIVGEIDHRGKVWTPAQPAYRAVKTVHEGKPVYVAQQDEDDDTQGFMPDWANFQEGRAVGWTEAFEQIADKVKELPWENDTKDSFLVWLREQK